VKMVGAVACRKHQPCLQETMQNTMAALAESSAELLLLWLQQRQ
jgi:hypothetical protein